MTEKLNYIKLINPLTKLENDVKNKMKKSVTPKRKRAHFADDDEVIEYSFKKVEDSNDENESFLLDENESHHLSPISNA